jgi:putative hydrolase of the HAD superfamily
LCGGSVVCGRESAYLRLSGPLRPLFRPRMTDPASPHASAPDARRFDHVETWIFDLDNTLYPHEARVWPQVDERITLYLMKLFETDGLSARALQKHYYHRYGTTLRGLMEEEGIVPADFLDFAHDIDHSAIELNPALGDAIERLPGRKLILTNGSRKHASNVATKLGIFQHFEDVFDIEAADFIPKPDRHAYDRFLAKHAVEPARAAMFEDIAKNLLV